VATERILRDHMNPLLRRDGRATGEFDVIATLRRSGEPFTLSPTKL